jgi:hypothetical protein
MIIKNPIKLSMANKEVIITIENLVVVDKEYTTRGSGHGLIIGSVVYV